MLMMHSFLFVSGKCLESDADDDDDEVNPIEVNPIEVSIGPDDCLLSSME